MKNKRENIIYLVIFILMAVIFLGGLGQWNHSKVMDQMNVVENQRSVDRNVKGDNLQAIVIQKKINACLYNRMYDYATRVPNHFKNNSKEVISRLVNDSETDCTSNLIENAAVGGNKNAYALAYFLIKENYAVSATYAKNAKQDDVALADVRF